MRTDGQVVAEPDTFTPIEEISPAPPAPDPPSLWSTAAPLLEHEGVDESSHAKVAEQVAEQFAKREKKNAIETEIAAIKSGQKHVRMSSTRNTADAWNLARQKVDATRNEVEAITKNMNILGEKVFVKEEKRDIVGQSGNVIGEKVDLVGNATTTAMNNGRALGSSSVKFDSTAIAVDTGADSGAADVIGHASATIVEDGEVVDSAVMTFGNKVPTTVTMTAVDSAAPSIVQERNAERQTVGNGLRDGNADDDIEISWNRATASGAMDGELSMGAGLENMSGNLAMDASSSSMMPFGTVANGSKAKDVNKPSVMTRIKTLVCKLPDPTLFFLFEIVTVLTLKIIYPSWKGSYIGRALTLVITLMTVGIAAVWRGTKMKGVPPTRVIPNPVRPIPRASQIVRRGEVLRAREAAVLKAEEELHMGQLKLRSMRSDIERRLPPAASISAMLKSDASVALDPLANAAYQAKDVIASMPTAGAIATPAGAVGAARAPSSDPKSFKTM